jgi:hypothetical protein
MEVVSELRTDIEGDLSLGSVALECEVIGALRKSIFGNCRDDSRRRRTDQAARMASEENSALVVVGCVEALTRNDYLAAFDAGLWNRIPDQSFCQD